MSFKTEQEASEYFSKKYGKNITFSAPYYSPETFNVVRYVLVDGQRSTDVELVSKIKEEVGSLNPVKVEND